MTDTTKTNDGGPAFPAGEIDKTTSGMSLRAWLAGKALEGLLAEGADPDVRCGFIEIAKKHDQTEAAIVAQMACGLADAVIAELEKGK